MSIKGLKQAKQKILEAKDIVIASHINPDGDSIGSLLSLGLGMETLGKSVYMICQDDVPKRYTLLPGANRIVKKIRKACDLAIAVDCGSKEMLGSAFSIFKGAKDMLEIDHHSFRRPFGNLRLIDTKAAAAGELIYLLLCELNVDISKDIAQNLLTSIIVETNSFRLPNVRPYTFQLCATLAKKKINFYKLVDMVYWSITRESAILTGICLSRCKFLNKGRIVWSIVTKKDFNSVKGKDEDIDPVADHMRSIRDVKIAILFREKDEKHLRVSLRSKGRVNVASVAEAYGGGGHFDIAGCHIPNSRSSIRRFLNMSKKLL